MCSFEDIIHIILRDTDPDKFLSGFFIYKEGEIIEVIFCKTWRNGLEFRA